MGLVWTHVWRANGNFRQGRHSGTPRAPPVQAALPGLAQHSLSGRPAPNLLYAIHRGLIAVQSGTPRNNVGQAGLW